MWIHEQPDWPGFNWDIEPLADLLAAVRHRQGRHLGRMESLGFDLRQQASLTAMTSDVVKSSAIEGERLDPREVRSSIARKIGLETAGLPQPGRAVEGVVEMMLDATQNNAAPLTVSRLHTWHASLFTQPQPPVQPLTVGDWRTVDSGPMQVVSGRIGREHVHFEAPHAERLDTEIAAFLNWFNMPSTVDPILTAAIAHLWFVTVHPYQDGNGRIARAIADMALARADGVRQRYYSMSTRIDVERKDYYIQLEHAQRGTLDITDWIQWFLGCLGRAIDQADLMLHAVLYKAQLWNRINRYPVNDRQRRVINLMLDDFKGHLSTSKYAKLAKCSDDTALRDIRELLQRAIIVRNPGGGRSTSYRLVENPASIDNDSRI